LVNAGKYSTTFFVVLFSTLNTAWALLGEDKNGDTYNPFFYLWISSSVIRYLAKKQMFLRNNSKTFRGLFVSLSLSLICVTRLLNGMSMV